MKKMTIKSLHIENFKGCKDLSVNFANETAIKGQNASGKTTIVDALFWLLFNKNSEYKEKFGVRPVDEDGNKIDHVVIMVEAVLVIDGKEIEIRKEQKQKWVTQRGTQIQQLKGNENVFTVDTIPMLEKDYKSYITDIIDENLFKLITSPVAFTNLPWKEQRDMLIKLVSEVTDEDVARSNIEKFGNLLIEIERYTFSGLQARANKAMKELKEEQKAIPIRIDELSKQIVDVDIAELELQKRGLEESIAELEKEESDIAAQYSRYAERSEYLLKKKFALSDMEREASEASVKERRAIDDEIAQLEEKLRDCRNTIYDAQKKISVIENQIRIADEDVAKATEEFNKIKSSSLDESETVCFNCGQAYPEDKIAEIRENFEIKKKEKLKQIGDQGNLAFRNSKEGKAEIDKLNLAVERATEQKLILEESLAKKKAELSNHSIHVDMSQNEEYMRLKAEIDALEVKLRNTNDSDSAKKALAVKKQGHEAELREVQRNIDKADTSAIEEKIENYNLQLREVSQKIADQEKELDLLKEFNTAKLDLLSTRINTKFKKVNFILFNTQENGGYSETCECMYEGVSYGNLNSGHKIVAGLDIISTLQSLYETECFVFVDNAETLNDFNIPEMDCQTILLKVSDSKQLEVA